MLKYLKNAKDVYSSHVTELNGYYSRFVQSFPNM